MSGGRLALRDDARRHHARAEEETKKKSAGGDVLAPVSGRRCFTARSARTYVRVRFRNIGCGGGEGRMVSFADGSSAWGRWKAPRDRERRRRGSAADAAAARREGGHARYA